VGAQVYASLQAGNASEPVTAAFACKGSDILYELRVLTQAERVAVASLAVEKSLDMDEAREVAKAVKDFSRLSSPPAGFSNHPGDAIAYQAWRLARQQADLQARSRLIAKGLRFAHSDQARQQIEQLLTDFTVTPITPAPRLPVYRLEASEQLPRVIPVVGRLPLTKADVQAVPLAEEQPPFGMVQFSGVGAWVPVPGWQVIQLAEDPIALLIGSDALPTPLPGAPEEVLIVIDRAQRQWETSQYFLIEQEGHVQLRWFETAPDHPLLGRVILVLRPQKILDENYTKDPWQTDE
jgi:hypothetical protein